MKIQNNTKTTYTHNDLKLLPDGAITEVTDEKVANIWLKIDGVVEYVEPEDVKATIKALNEEIEKLKKENAALKEEKELVFVEEEQAIMTQKEAKEKEVKKETKKTTKKGK